MRLQIFDNYCISRKELLSELRCNVGYGSICTELLRGQIGDVYAPSGPV